MTKNQFWKTKNMHEMSSSEWESLCDGCGKCCCIRMEDEDTGAIYVTNVTCKLFDTATCQCTNYPNRTALVPDCVQVTPDNAGALKWMPRTCSYRLIAEGKDLPDYHHLITGSRQTINEQGMSVQHATVSEEGVPEDEQHRFIVQWPGEPEIG
ncbi:MAG: YcgN family cysteine cluster protein [Robiginitomaculum sp.]